MQVLARPHPPTAWPEPVAGFCCLHEKRGLVAEGEAEERHYAMLEQSDMAA